MNVREVLKQSAFILAGGIGVVGSAMGLLGRTGDAKKLADSPFETLRTWGLLLVCLYVIFDSLRVLGAWRKLGALLRGKASAAAAEAEPPLGVEAFSDAARVDPLQLPGEAVVRLTSRGLGTRELELIEIPAHLAPAGAALLRELGSMLGEQPGYQREGFLKLERPSGSAVCVQLHAVTSAGAEVLRITDPHRELSEPAKMAVCNAAARVARMGDEALEDEGEAADLDDRQLLRAAIEWFPAHEAPHFDYALNVNQRNNLVHFALALGGGEDGELHYAEALARSPLLVQSELGGQLPALPRELLSAEVAALVKTLHATLAESLPAPGQSWENPGRVEGMGFLVSPILHLRKGELMQTLCIGLLEMRAYFYTSPARYALQEPQVAGLVADIYQRALDAPCDVLVRCFDTAVKVYEQHGVLGEPLARPLVALQSAAGTLAHIPLLSRITACVGRELAAGLTLAELRARWRLADDPELVLAGEAKLARQRADEEERLGRSMQELASTAA